MSTLSMAHPAPVVATNAPPATTQATEACVREATPADAAAIHALITEHIVEGHLLPRSLEEIRLHAHRFLVAVRDGHLAGCGELAPLSDEVGEVRSLVVNCDLRSSGLGTEIVDRIVERATSRGFQRLCAFTHRPAYFVRQGFSLVPHVWLPEKILTDCNRCPQFRRCGQYAVVRTLGRRGLHG